MRSDLPTPIRRELDQQRLEFIRWVGREYEALIARGIDPAPWMARVVTDLARFVAEHEHQEAA